MQWVGWINASDLSGQLSRGPFQMSPLTLMPALRVSPCPPAALEGTHRGAEPMESCGGRCGEGLPGQQSPLVEPTLDFRPLSCDEADPVHV